MNPGVLRLSFRESPSVRLTSIKLSGFKSFADPTQFVLPGQLVGVVGPNGCGKSNIMDAVRWVLGESRASELRGESMQDVIFNGTTSRKPAGRASVELVFDNSDHRAGGQWSQFAEVAVKRVLTRDGTSSYYINNQPVRRRDVQDVFLGTGLGPRAYAIIGQGTVGRIIESRPEELRLFLEEAAGVSKYKERRRETEQRLGDTRENLTRVEDILRELDGNLVHLQEQAKVAQVYNDLTAQATLKQRQLWWIRRRECEADQSRARADAEKAQTELEARVADLRCAESDLEQLRQAHFAAGDQVNKAQGLYYDAGAEVTRLEAEIRFVVESRQRAQQRLAVLADQARQWSQGQAQADAALLQIGQDRSSLTERLAQAEAEVAAQQAQLPAAESAWREAQARSREQTTAVGEVQRQLQVLAEQQRGFDERERVASQRRERMRTERTQLNAPDGQRHDEVRRRSAEAQETAQSLDGQFHEAQDQLPALEQARRTAQTLHAQESRKQAELSARLDALRALQEKLKTDGKLAPWLARNGLESLEALWSRIQVQAGWETAIESALRERLRALQVSRLELAAGFADAGVANAPPARLVFFQPAPGVSSTAQVGANAPAGLSPLVDRVQTGDAGLRGILTEWLAGCWSSESLAAALAARAQLTPGQQVFLASGHQVSANSLGFYAADSEQAGMLARSREIDNLDRQLRAQALVAEEAHAAALRADAAATQASQRMAELRREAAAAQSRAHELQMELLRLDQQAEQIRQRSERLDGDLAEIDAQMAELAGRRSASEQQFEQLDMQLGAQQERQARLEEAVHGAEQALQAQREKLQAANRQLQEWQFDARSLQARQSEQERMRETAQRQLQTVVEEQQAQEAELARLSDAAAQAGLQSALAVRVEREQTLAARRSEYDDLTQRLRGGDERRMGLEREIEPMRARITDLQLKEQAARLGVEQYAQHLADAQADEAQIAASVEADGVRLTGLQAEIDRLQREITALGAVNLAALQELGAASERKTFLDAQSADLREAMTTLEDAIRKIDAETRDLLGQTFATVNEHFGKMFPVLFGGGHAHLEMTGAEILDSGVQVMARPPGKTIQRINLMSGGEKALTAIALVFAIFQLNPAPFCLLDEVDAPLDDANTERYAKLVTSMSQQTQFLFISHNKIAMEMAEQLIGVTMQERGVSRIVAVDMETAGQLNAESISG